MIERRGFLGLLLAIPTGGLLGSAPKSRRPKFDQAGADVWATQAKVSGVGHVQVTVNGRAVPTVNHRARFSATVPLNIGVNHVVATGSDGGSARLVLRCRLSPRPVAVAHGYRDGDMLRLSASNSRPNPVTHAPLAGYHWIDDRGTVLARTASTTVSTTVVAGARTITVQVGDRDSRHDRAALVIDPRTGAVASPDSRQLHRPEWIERAVIYGVVPPLFGVRPFHAVTQHVPRLARLGVTVLWLAPVFRAVPGDYGYEVTDLFRIRPDYGTEAELQHLIEVAHEHGLRVILDLPVNDTSRRHPYFEQTERLGSRSHYYPFYERDRNGNAEHYFDWRQLPNLSYDNPEVRAMVIAGSLHWLDRLGHDGYRVDAAWGVQRRRPEFWRTWSEQLRRRDPDLLLIAEGTALDASWRHSGFDAAYDWTHELGEWSWHSAFGHPDTAHRLRVILGRRHRTPPMRYLDDNDTGRRFVSTYGIGTTRAATAMLLTLPGLPEIFTGSEIGAAYSPYQRTTPLDWHHDPDHLQRLHRDLIGRRRRTPQLSGRGLRVLSAARSDPVLSYVRSSSRTGGEVTVSINFSDRSAGIEGPDGGTLAPWAHHITKPR